MHKLYLTLVMLVILTPFAWAQEKPASAYSAGYKWAEDEDIQDETDCKSGPPEFIRGCKDWVNDTPENKSEEDSDDERED